MKPASSPGIAHILNHLSADCMFQTPPLGTAVHRHVPTAVQKRLDEVVQMLIATGTSSYHWLALDPTW